MGAREYVSIVTDDTILRYLFMDTMSWPLGWENLNPIRCDAGWHSSRRADQVKLKHESGDAQGPIRQQL
eukprot:3611456-Pleurochrysis_carterae.AAC.3